MEIHLDPLGGWSGDMFVAAMLDAFPEFWPPVEAAVLSLDLGPDSACRLVAHRDTALTGRRFIVAAEHGAGEAGHQHEHHAHEHHHHDHDHHDHDHAHGHHDHEHHEHAPHGHRAWASIRAMLAGSDLDQAVKDHAIAIFGLLAEAEAKVHGVEPDAVTFHEVGAVDSIVDIVAAAQLIVLVGATHWSSAPLPLGSGRVRTAHGILPVPAPATALLMAGLSTIDDGIAGERVTPTGAAVARHLLAGRASRTNHARRLTRTGIGFGTRTMPGISNCLRVLAFEPGAGTGPATGEFSHRELAVIAFEVDDQSGEDLAAGLDHIRALPGIHDVIQSVAFGKKGRMATHVQVLAAPDARDRAIAACFEETTTIGLRYQLVHGAALTRSFDEANVEGQALRVKSVRRPDGQVTAKTEASDVAGTRGHGARVRLRRKGEAAVLRRAAKDGTTEQAKDADHDG